MITIHAKGIARIRHKTTKEVFEVNADELDWELVGSDERQMGPENSYAAVVDHPVLGQLTWWLWEYPLGAENDIETNVGGHELIENIRFGIAYLPDDDDLREDKELGLSLEQRLATLPTQLDELDRALTRLSQINPLMGHNQPPEEFRLRLDEDEIDAARKCIVDLRSELKKPGAIASADAEILALSEGWLRRLGEKISAAAKWIGKYGAAGVVTGIGKELWEDPIALSEKLVSIADTVAVWMAHVIQQLL